MKLPPAYKSLPLNTSDETAPPPGPFVPVPMADQLLPFHFAIKFAAMPSALVKIPPAYRSAPLSANADTRSFRPVPSADQAFPSHFAILFALTPPAVVR